MKQIKYIIALVGILSLTAFSGPGPIGPIHITSVKVNSIKVNGKALDVKFTASLLNISMECISDPNGSDYMIQTTTQWNASIPGGGGEEDAAYLEADLSVSYFAAGHQHTFTFTDMLPFNHKDTVPITYVYYVGQYTNAFPHYYALSSPQLLSYTVAPY